MLVLAALFVLCFIHGEAVPVKNEVELRMPNVKPSTNDTYLCHGMKLGNDPIYITEFIPKAKMEIAHHILLYGCSEIGSKDSYWNCGEMGSTVGKTPANHAPICKSGSKIIYAWAMDAPRLRLPEKVSFKVGGDTDIKGLVLQVHYKDVRSFLPPSKKTDKSGIKMITQTTPTPKLAGIYLLGSDGVVPAKSQVYFDAACKYTGRAVLHAFAYRVHTHTHGEVVSGYRVRQGKWNEIGRQSPQKPQMFYKLKKVMNIRPGDDLASRCVMNNLKGKKDVYVGNTQSDEMCNFYMMYWVTARDAAQLSDPDNQNCWSDGFPRYLWATDANLNLKGIPAEAAMLPNTNKMFKMNEKANAILRELQEEEELESRALLANANFLPTNRRSYDEYQQDSYFDDNAEDWS